MSFLTSSLSASPSFTVTAAPQTFVPATRTELPALTTAFVPPPACPTVDELKPWESLDYYNTTSSYAIFYSDPANESYSSCQPSGWAEMLPFNRHSYSPGVCPSNWAAISMGYSTGRSSVFSSAYCCPTGYYLWKISSTYARDFPFSLDMIRELCTKDDNTYWLPTTVYIPVTSDNYTYTRYYTSVKSVQPAWYVEWQKSDLSTITPRPPDLTSNMLIWTWTPGMSISAGQYDNYGSGRYQSGYGSGFTELYFFVTIGVPLIVVSLMMCCCCCCWRSKKKERKLQSVGVTNGEVELAEGVGSANRGNEGVVRREDEDDPPPAYAPPAYSLSPPSAPEERRG